MPIGPVELMFCLFGFIVIPAVVAIAVMMRREDLEWPRRGIEGLKYAASVALIALIVFVLLVLLLNEL